jgi:hypothetical protein
VLLGPGADQYPPGLRWKAFDTPHFEIVFPEALETEARRAAGRAESMIPPLSRALGRAPRRTTLVLGNQGVEANGFAALAPRKSEWFHKPPSGALIGTGEWYALLAAHEGRHLVQFEMAETGFTRFASWIMGDLGLLAFSFLSLPQWWWEGDAVVLETALTESGRGRIPEFEAGLRALLLEGRDFSYAKMTLGSYRDWTPDPYRLGYALNAHFRARWGADALARTVARSARASFWPLAFSNALRRETGLDAPGLLRDAADSLRAAWSGQARGLGPGPDPVFGPDPKVHTDYLFPVPLEDGSVVAQRSGFDDPWSLVRIGPDGAVRSVTLMRPTEPGGSRAGAAGATAVWDEAVPDLRWGARAWSVIVSCDLATGRTRRLGRRTRLFDPDLSPDGRRIAAVEFHEDRRCGLAVLDAGTGNRMKTFPGPAGAWLQSPSWSADGAAIVCTAQAGSGKSVVLADAETGAFRTLVAESRENLSRPVLRGRYLLYSSPESGVDNLCARDTATGSAYRITSIRAGAYAPRVTPDGEFLVFEVQTPRGRRVGRMPFRPGEWTPLESAPKRPLALYAAAAAQETGPRAAALRDSALAVRPYRAWPSALRPHSWAVVPDPPEVRLTLFSADRLNTLALEPALTRNTDEDASGLELNGTYAGWFTPVHAGFGRRGRSVRNRSGDGPERRVKWEEYWLRFGASVPLDFSRGGRDTRVSAGADFTAAAARGRAARKPAGLPDGGLFDSRAWVRFSNAVPGSARDLAPPRAQRADFEIRSAGSRGGRMAGAADLFVPGAAPHHALRLGAAAERAWREPSLFPSAFRFCRGFAPERHESLWRVSADYAFPLAYPDWAAGSIVYLKRVRAGLFADWSEGLDGGRVTRYRSLGVELRGDTHFFCLPLSLDPGLRAVFLPDRGRWRLEPVLFWEF